MWPMPMPTPMPEVALWIYHNDPNRIYGMPFLTFDIRFKVADNVLTVVEIK